jgi:hypothetical protein
MTQEQVNRQNAIVLLWTPKVRRLLRGSAAWFSDGKTEPFVIRGKGSKTRTEGKLVNSIRESTRKNYGEIDTISFTFERHGVFVHKGVGRGYEQSGRFVVRTAKGPVTRERVAVEWFNPILDKTIPELADKIANVNADAALNATRMKIS